MSEKTNPWENDPFAAAYPETSEFWAAAADGRLMLNVCDDCGKAHWFPRAVCPMCGSSKLSWKQASGKGKVYAFSPARRADPVYTLAYVTLEEGPTMMTNIIDTDPESIEIGQAVQVKFKPADEGRMMPFFAPV